ncbi:MAG: hypothetical protein ICV66_03905 [Chitinophagaceae bacterium]|nr:hypothetical protein [Chitinophagaceae bacterium]
MKKIFIIAFLTLIVFVSCNKEEAEGKFHVSFSVNGVNKTFTGHVFAHTETSGDYTVLTVNGSNTSTSFDNYLGFYLDNFPGRGNITTGQYEDISNNYTLLSTYAVDGVEYEAGQSVAEDAESYNINLANHFKVNITSMDANTIRGTFSGDYYEDGDVQNGIKLNITNGEFYAEFQ